MSDGSEEEGEQRREGGQERRERSREEGRGGREERGREENYITFVVEFLITASSYVLICDQLLAHYSMAGFVQLNICS